MPQRSAPPFARSLATRTMYALADNYARFAEDVWTRYWRAGATGFRQALRIVEHASVQPFDAEGLFAEMLGQYADYLSAMTIGGPAAAELAAARLRETARPAPHELEPFVRGAPPGTRTRLRELPGPAGSETPFALPARVIEGSQGWAVYLVSAETAASVLGENARFAAPFDAGGRRTLLVVSGSDFRVGDLGSYREIALALAVVPRADPHAAPGTMFVGFVVSGEFTRDASRAIWGLEKVVDPDLAVSYAPDIVRFGLDRPDSLAATFPRFGTRRSDHIPLLVYSRLAEPDPVPVVSLMTRGGRGEGVQIGGSVVLRLGLGNPSGCACRGSAEQCLCRTFARFGVAGRLPAANGWTEHLSGTFDAPRRLSALYPDHPTKAGTHW